MPWREFLTADEQALIKHPDARAHHLGHDRVATILQSLVVKAISAANPSLGNSPRAVLNNISKEDSFLNPYYVQVRNYIVAAVGTIDASTGDHAVHVSDWIDHHAAQLIASAKKQLGQ